MACGRRAGGLALFLLASVSLAARGQVLEGDLIGRTVVSLSYTCDKEVDRREVEGLIAIEVGRPLTEASTGATIRNLYGTLRFFEVAVEAEPAGEGGVAVTVHLWRSFRVRGVEFEGKVSLSREDLRRAVPLSAGDPFSASALESGTSTLERRLAADGYFHAVVSPDVTFDEQTLEVAIVYEIAAGARARVAAPFFDGATEPFSAALLAEKGKVKIGKPYREAQARAASERMRKYLLEQGYLRGNVGLIAAEPTEGGEVLPVFRIDVGPVFDVRAVGTKEKAARKEILALLEGQSFDEDLLDFWSANRKEELQKAGHYRAKVSAAASGDGPVVVALTVEPGPKYSVEKISIAGNASVSEETLRELVVVQTKGLPVLQKGRLLDRDLEGDASAILGYYQTHGWIDARVEKPSVTEGSRPDRLDVAFRIVEGSRAYVGERRVLGAEHLSEADLERLISVRAGEPFNPAAVRQDISALTSYYWNDGWREASVQDHYTLSEDRTRVDLEYRIVEGERSFFGKTILHGNALTDADRILRQVAWKEGEPFSDEKIAETQQNLARTGVFRTVGVRPQAADPDDQSRAIKLDVTEARRLSLLYGFGYQNAASATQYRNDVFGVVGVTYRNLFGRMQSASLELQYAPLSQRGHIFASYLEPYLFGSSIPLNFIAFVSREPIQDVDINRVGGYLESYRRWGKYTRVALRYEYQQIGPANPEDLSTIELEQYPKSAQPIKQSAIGPSVLYDRRDDVLNPQSGYYWTLAGKYAFPFITADATYGKVSGQAAWFHRLLGGVLGASIRAGTIFQYDLASGVPVPIAERFYSGGSAMGRGFATDLLGIPGVTVDYNTQATPAEDGGEGNCAATYPDDPAVLGYDCNLGPRIIGGNGFMSWALEWRVPIFGDLGVSIFYDLSQVWQNAGDINFRIEGQNGMRQSIGAGLHYMTPVGPLRLEYGIPLQRRTIDFQVTATQNLDETPCDPSPCVLVESVTTKETGRVLLSIGYPF